MSRPIVPEPGPDQDAPSDVPPRPQPDIDPGRPDLPGPGDAEPVGDPEPDPDLTPGRPVDPTVYT